MKHSLSVMLVMTACLGAAVRSVDACVCVGYTDVSPERQKRELKSEIDSARAIFVGELIARNSLMLRFRVQSVWKGDVGAEVVMSTGSRATSDGLMTSSSCDVSFSFDTAYLVFAHGGTAETMKAHACSSTGPVTAESLTALDALVKPRPPSAEVVPRQLVAVIGTVRNPGVVEWKPGLTVAQALALAGGPVPVLRREIAEFGLTSRISGARAGLSGVHRPALPDALLSPDDELFIVGDVRKRPE